MDTKTAKRSVIALNVTVIVVSLINTLLLVWQNAFSYKDRAAVYLKARKDFDNAFHTLLKEQAADDMRVDQKGNRDFAKKVGEFIDAVGDIIKSAALGRALGLVDVSVWKIDELNDTVAKLKKNLNDEKERTATLEKEKAEKAAKNDGTTPSA